MIHASGVVTLPFLVNPEEDGDFDGDHQYPNFEGSIIVAERQ